MAFGWKSVASVAPTIAVIALGVASGVGCASKAIVSPTLRPVVRQESSEMHWRVVIESPRVIVRSNGSREDARQHARWMERTIEEFERFTRRVGWPTRALDEPLIALLFPGQRELQAFASQHDRVNIGPSSGYYSPRNDWVAMNTGGRTSASSHHHRAFQNARMTVAFQANPQAATALHSDESDAALQRGSAAARCVHETIHQLLFRSGLMDQQVTYPLWIAEGLATAFETDDPGSPVNRNFGPDVDHAPRSQAFAAALSAGRLIPLRKLITVTRLPHESIDMHDFYNQSYALTTWLCRERPGEMLGYLRLLNEGDSPRRSENPLTSLFERAFGSIDLVASEWLNAMR